VGPAYADVGLKYHNEPEAIEKLTAKVKNGGAGVWGQTVMPPQVAVSAKRLGQNPIRDSCPWFLTRFSATHGKAVNKAERYPETLKNKFKCHDSWIRSADHDTSLKRGLLISRHPFCIYLCAG
jgi:hypothetical protein